MDVSKAVEPRMSVRAFKATVPPACMVREILRRAARAPSGGNLQPWQVHVLAGEPLLQLKERAALVPQGESPEYQVYPPSLWDPYRSRRYENGEDLYAVLGIASEDKASRLRQMSTNAQMFGAPVRLFFCPDRRLGQPQWSDFGMFMQTVMLLAVEQGLDTCAQKFWSRYPNMLADALALPREHMVFSDMALGWRVPDHPINRLHTSRAPLEQWLQLRGFPD
jgi:nitroreductase